MCAGAIVWSKIDTIAYGYSISEAVSQNRPRIDLHCDEVFSRAKADIRIYAGVMATECAVLYRSDVRQEIKNLRNADASALSAHRQDSIDRRIMWFRKDKSTFDFIGDDLLVSGYRLLLERLHISPGAAPVVSRTDKEIDFHSQTFAPPWRRAGF